ncbi:hypothetical protein [Paraburkholderia sp. J67]|uniref:hypothetical protein n=1 Tax=Paraburkholderia sp. J67 TaxID=2805435 RepID=UPI002ABE9129|nr:hypothetical protein [Paraburkholderia sp. J67]
MTELSSAAPLMGVPAFSRGRRGAFSASLRGWRPLHAWSARRRAAFALTLGVVAAVLTGAACVTMDVGGRETAGVALADAQARLVSARQTLARLPALRRDAQDWPQRPRHGSAADDMRDVSQLAAQAGLALVALEPVSPGSGKMPVSRGTKLMAQGSFAQLRDFLDGLAELPELAVPVELTLRRGAGGLAISATLQVFDGLPAIAFAQDAQDGGALADPFADRLGRASGATEDAAMRLAGVLVERGRAVALVETASGTTAVQAGTTLAGARVLEVNPARVVLALDGATQTLHWAGADR